MPGPCLHAAPSWPALPMLLQLYVVDRLVDCESNLRSRWCIQERGFPLAKIVEGPLHFFIFAVTIVVVAVPEGLPLAVTISLAYRCKP